MYVQQHRHLLHCLEICPYSLLCLSSPSPYHLPPQILPVSIRLFSRITYLTSGIFLFLLLSYFFPYLKYSLCFHYNTLFISVTSSFIIIIFYWLPLIFLGTMKRKKDTSCSQLGLVLLKLKRNGNPFEDFKILPQETVIIFLMHVSAIFVMLLIELTALLAAS